jgi:cyclin-C
MSLLKPRNRLCSSRTSLQKPGSSSVVCTPVFVFGCKCADGLKDESYNIKTFPSDNTKLAEMEFYLVDDLECDLTVFHPYRTLLALCAQDSADAQPEPEAGEVDDWVDAGQVGEEGGRYWGTGRGQLELQKGGLQMAWYVVPFVLYSILLVLRA